VEGREEPALTGEIPVGRRRELRRRAIRG